MLKRNVGGGQVACVGGGHGWEPVASIGLLRKYVLCCWSARDGRFDGDCSLGGGG
jgi:hypothetical protein